MKKIKHGRRLEGARYELGSESDAVNREGHRQEGDSFNADREEAAT